MEQQPDVKELQEQLELMTTKLARSFLNSVDILGELISAFDVYHEGNHGRFVSEKSTMIARFLGLNNRQVYEIGTAGLLHDIGKIALPPDLLAQNPAELNAYDFKHYASHVETGARILSMHDGFHSIADIISQHHERYDGMGFPNKKKNSSIHIGARIIAVANFYHNRMYKIKGSRHEKSQSITSQIAAEGESLRHIQTMNLIQKRIGSMLDPKVVAAFNAVIENERRAAGMKAFLRVSINQLRPGMRFAEDLRTSYGLLIASQGDPISESTIPKLVRFAESKEIPVRLLVLV